MKMQSIFTPGPIIASMALALIAPGALADERESEENDPPAALGEEVDRICFRSSINNWRAVKGENDVILLERGINDWYRVELYGACSYSVLRSALTIGFESRSSLGCVRRGDSIIVEDGPGFNRRCTIKRIYRWDEEAGAEDDDSDDDDAPAPDDDPDTD